ncbi:MAG: hypothetical protein ACE5IC_09600 [Candidatus Brocadiales bacterium]
MHQGLQAFIAAAAITFLVGIFFGIQILFRRFALKDRTKKPEIRETQVEGDKQHHKKLKLKKNAG